MQGAKEQADRGSSGDLGRQRFGNLKRVTQHHLNLFAHGHKRPLDFKPGLARLVERIGPFEIYPVAVHIEPLQNKKPTAFVSVGEPLSYRMKMPAGEIESHVTAELDALLSFVSRYGENAIDAWPDVNTRLRSTFSFGDNAGAGSAVA